MSAKSLYIIGNGFDLHHGMKTSYYDFREYLKQEDRDLLAIIETYLYDDELWSDFEGALASLDIDSVIDFASNVLVSYSAEDWSDANHHNYQYEIDQVVGALSHRLKEAFTAWIKEIQIPTRSQAADKILSLEKDALYLNFNYTPTLERLYNVPITKTTFIHGSIANGDNNLILGHAWNPKDNSPMIDEKNPEDMDTRILEGNDLINRYFDETYKPTDRIIADNKAFFESLHTVQKIYIFGHSLSVVDMPYFEAIVEHIDLNNVEWMISYRSKAKRQSYADAMGLLGIESSNLKFIKLNDLTNGVEHE